MLRSWYNLNLSSEKQFARMIRDITGYGPGEMFLYHLAMRHSSLVTTRKSSARECNERLEFLGDTVLDAVVSEYLFKLYPTQDEGFLTEMRAKIVNRRSLNDICRLIKLDSLVQYHASRKGQVNKSMYGDALEAFIGAVYLDLGFERTKRFILKKIIGQHLDMDEVEDTIFNYKSMLLEYVQKEKLEPLVYEMVHESGDGNNKMFRVNVRIGTRVMGSGEGKKKKIAEQNASENALINMKVIDAATGQVVEKES